MGINSFMLFAALLGLCQKTFCAKDPLGSPVEVRVDYDVGSAVVIVYWKEVEDADRYTVTFTQAQGMDQEGPCPSDSHNASVSVNTKTAIIHIGQDVEPSNATILRAFTTYFITVVAESDVHGTSHESDPITFTTQQTSAAEAPGTTQVEAGDINSTSIRVRWRGLRTCRLVNGLIVGYRVQYSAEPDGIIQTKDKILKVRKWNSRARALLTGLTPFTNYCIQIAAVNIRQQVGKYSKPKIIQTGEANPGPVQLVTVVPSFSEVTITWKEPAVPNGVIIAYEVSYWPISSSQPMTRMNTTDMTTSFNTTDFATSVSTTNLAANFNTTDLATNFTIQRGLNRGTKYIFSVRAYTQAGPGNATSVPISIPNLPSNDTGDITPSYKNIDGPYYYAVTTVVVSLLFVTTSIALGLTMYHCVNRSKPSTLRSSISTHSNSSYNNEQMPTEPRISKFPSDKHVIEGEEVVFIVKVTGVPVPVLTWYHNGEGVVTDHSKDLAEDGSLTMPSAEIKHSGVYQLVAVNGAGRADKEVKLCVRKEGEPHSCAVRKNINFSPIPVAKFGDYVAKSHANDNSEFEDHYATLDRDPEHPITVCKRADFKLLNRYHKITVYDNNRIVLRPIEGHSDCQRDFINASYIDGYKSRHKFIATQGPLPRTVVDFWRLMWQEKPPTIVMITNLTEGTRTKCHQYWPEIGSQLYGPFKVSITDQQILADYTTRTLLVQLMGSLEVGLQVTQFHYTAWPDHGVPDYTTSILSFHKKVMKRHKSSKGPLLMHCSAGVGRTGTLITIDWALDQIQQESVVDIANIIKQLRNQRMKMVQNTEQYIFIHDVILEAVMCGNTQIIASDLRGAIHQLCLRDPQTHTTGFEHQFKVLNQVSCGPHNVQQERAPNKCDTVPKNIHSVVVNGYKRQRAFIISKNPCTETTARDLWKMIYERRCGVIVMLCDLVENGKEVCHQYWPTTEEIQVGELTVNILGNETLPGFIIRAFSVLHNKSRKIHRVFQIQVTCWSPDGSCSNIASITAVITEMIKIQQRTGNHPILVHCSDTVSRSGMFCAIATTIEKCKTEGVVDVFQVVKALRVQKSGAVCNVMQYKIIFDAILEFLDSFDNYANF